MTCTVTKVLNIEYGLQIKANDTYYCFDTYDVEFIREDGTKGEKQLSDIAGCSPVEVGEIFIETTGISQ